MNPEAANCRELKAGLAWGAGLLALALGASLSRKLGYIDGDTVKRLVTGAIGVWLAWYGNRMPKTFVPNACARQARRVAGWSMALSGLIYAGLWAFAPITMAVQAGTVAIVGGIALTLGYCLSLRGRAKAS